MIVTGSAACGTVENLSAGQKIDRAFDKLGKENSLTVEFGLDVDAATLKALDADSAPEDKMPQGIADLFSDGRVSITLDSKKPLKDSGEKDFAGMAIKVSGKDDDLIEFRVVDETAYVRANVKGFGELVGYPMPGADELPEEAGAFKDALEGKWIKIPSQELREAQNQMATEPGAKPKPVPTLDAAQQKKYTKLLQDVITREVDFETADGKDGAERITATAPFRTLATELVKEFRPLAKEMKWDSNLPSDKELKEAPNEKVKAEFLLKDGTLTELNVDLAKLTEDPKVKKFGLKVTFGKGEKVTAPAGAAPLSMDEVFEGMFGGMGADELSGAGLDEAPSEGFSFEETA
ncbi:hypothetical protein ABT354_12895 [Streptomyces sp. NPDC000594]|uniref:hypothetical protein n=1 Tax=Streptomyces sp. NPDC000594 TaxID=3154261 RepID=UPI0033178B6A